MPRYRKNYLQLFLRQYLYGKKFTKGTDHRPLTWILIVKDQSSRILRWRLKQAEYEYEVIWKNSSNNSNAAALSRIHLLNSRTDGHYNKPRLAKEEKQGRFQEMHDQSTAGHLEWTQLMREWKLYIYIYIYIYVPTVLGHYSLNYNQVIKEPKLIWGFISWRKNQTRYFVKIIATMERPFLSQWHWWHKTLKLSRNRTLNVHAKTETFFWLIIGPWPQHLRLWTVFTWLTLLRQPTALDATLQRYKESPGLYYDHIKAQLSHM